VSGVTAVKNLAEQGFDVVGYERNNHIGGLWHYHEDPSQTKVL
jgi:dimethylaniline monooxygenase (N-oxide forming)